MSSSHLIILARNTLTGELRLPLDDMTLYGTGEEQSVVETAAMTFTDDWVLNLYAPVGDQVIGKKPHPVKWTIISRNERSAIFGGKHFFASRCHPLSNWNVVLLDRLEINGSRTIGRVHQSFTTHQLNKWLRDTQR